MAEIFIYDDIGAFFGGYTDKQAVKDLQAVEPQERIKLRINSQGGSVFEGVAIHTAFSQHPGGVDVQIDGVAASAASVIATVGQTVAIADGARIMIHEAQSGVFGDAGQMRKEADLLDDINKDMAKIYASFSGKTVDEILQAMAVETWLGADAAVEFGLATEKLDTLGAVAYDISEKFNYRNIPDKAESQRASLAATVRRIKLTKRAQKV